MHTCSRHLPSLRKQYAFGDVMLAPMTRMQGRNLHVNVQVVCMMVGVLRASSEYAKANGAASGPDIVLLQEVTHIGRNVPKTSGLPLPMTLAQVSGKHCQVIGNPHLVRRAMHRLLSTCLHAIVHQQQWILATTLHDCMIRRDTRCMTLRPMAATSSAETSR
jgi:hypothetical protein